MLPKVLNFKKETLVLDNFQVLKTVFNFNLFLLL